MWIQMYVFHERVKETNIKGEVLSSESGPASQKNTAHEEITSRFSRGPSFLRPHMPCEIRPESHSGHPAAALLSQGKDEPA